MPHTIQFLLTHDKTALEAALGLNASSARIEVQCLLQAVLHVNRAHLLTHPEPIGSASHLPVPPRKKDGIISAHNSGH